MAQGSNSRLFISEAVHDGRRSSRPAASSRLVREVFDRSLFEDLFEKAAANTTWFRQLAASSTPCRLIETVLGYAPELSDTALRLVINQVLREL